MCIKQHTRNFYICKKNTQFTVSEIKCMPFQAGQKIKYMYCPPRKWNKLCEVIFIQVNACVLTKFGAHYLETIIIPFQMDSPTHTSNCTALICTLESCIM